MKRIDKWKMKDILWLLIIFWLCVINGLIWFNIFEGWKGVLWVFEILIN